MPKPPVVQTTDLDQTPQYTPSAMASPHLTGGLSRDVGEWWQRSLSLWSFCQDAVQAPGCLCVLR